MHDIAAARATGFLRAVHAAAALLGLPALAALAALADKGYHGAGIGIHMPAKGAHLAPSTATRNQLLTRLRAEGERGIALLKTRWKALRHVRLGPAADRCDRRCSLGPDHRRATNPLRTPHWRVQTACGDIPPVEYENAFYLDVPPVEPAHNH
jgi:hypothetical protein